MAAYRVRVALALKQISVREVEVDLSTGQQFDPVFVEQNPEGVVPALAADGRLHTQSMALLEYMEERFPEPPLLPKDLIGRTRVRSLSELITADTHPLITPRVRTRYVDQTGADQQSWGDWTRFWLDRGLAAFEGRLQNDPSTGRFCHGDAVTFADICLASLVLVAESYGYSAVRYASVTRVLEACRSMPEFAFPSKD